MANLRGFSSGRTFGRSQRRKTSWGAGPAQPVLLGQSAAGTTIWAAGSQALDDGETLVRIRGQYSIILDLVTAAGDGFGESAMGIGLVTSEAFVAGVTAMPSPLTDMDWDGWIWHQLFGPFRGQSTTELGVFPLEAVRGEIDSKAMRKVKEGMILFGATELGLEVGTADLAFGATTRILFKLP